jgi:hypothetical protein
MVAVRKGPGIDLLKVIPESILKEFSVFLEQSQQEVVKDTDGETPSLRIDHKPQNYIEQ